MAQTKEVFQFCNKCKTETSQKKKNDGNYECNVCGGVYELPLKGLNKKKVGVKPKPSSAAMLTPERPKRQRKGKASVWEVRDYDGKPYQKQPDGTWKRFYG